MTKREKTIAVLESIETGDPAPFAYINPIKYIQHNLMIPTGVEGIAGMVANMPPQGFKAKVVRAFEDGDYVFAHTIYDFFGPKIGFDVFRFENDLIVEHWDNLIAILPNNQSDRSQIDGPTAIVDQNKTEENKKLVERFVTENWLEGKNNYEPYFANNVYVQHNPMGKDGVTSFLATMDYFQQVGISMYFTKLHKVLGEGNFVLTMSEGMFGENGGVPTSFYDLFRIENDKIVEHWDVIEPILPEAMRQNNNGKF